jgi:hypothetical protein
LLESDAFLWGGGFSARFKNDALQDYYNDTDSIANPRLDRMKIDIDVEM